MLFFIIIIFIFVYGCLRMFKEENQDNNQYQFDQNEMMNIRPIRKRRRLGSPTNSPKSEETLNSDNNK